MQIKNMAKKVAAIGVGAAMLGATLTSALALGDLGNYPAPFVTDGVLDNTVIVVGESAKTADVLGAVDIAASLQAEATSPVELEGTTVDPSVTSGVKISKSGDKFNYGEDIYGVNSEPLDENDLDLLAEGEYDDNEGDNKQDEGYDQELQFESGVATFMLSQPEDMDGGSYIKIDKSDRVYNYTLEFDSSVSYATGSIADDFEGTTLGIQGNTYTISEASGTSGVLDKLKLLAGDSTIWLVQDQPFSVGDHTVTVVDVDNSETKCGVNVDGQTKWVDEGTTEEYAGLSVGVLDVVAVYTKDYDADTCQLSLGSSELVLEDGEPVTVNNEELEGSDVSFQGSAGAWDGFTIRYQAGKEDSGVNSDEIHLAPGNAWTDPVFGNFKVLFEGVTRKDETLRMDSGGDDATFTFTNSDGKKVEVPFHAKTNGAIFPGADDDEPLLRPGDETGVGWVPSVTDPEDVKLFYTTSGGEVHILEITDVTCDSSTNKTSIRDLTYDSSVAKDEALTSDCQSSAISTVSLGSLGSIKLNITSSSVKFVNASGFGDGVPETEYEGIVGFTNDSMEFTEDAGDEAGVSTVSWGLTWDGTDDEITITGLSGHDDGPVDNGEDDDDTVWYRTDKGTLIKYDQEDKLWVELMAPEEDAYANVFVAPLSASVVAGSSGGGSAEQVNPFSVGLAVLDSDAESMNKNMIVVGGPCVNTVAAELMENPETCTEGFEPGMAMLKYFERNGNDALLVAGYEAQDTLGASYVLADHGQYDLSGDEVEVVVTSLDQISVNTV